MTPNSSSEKEPPGITAALLLAEKWARHRGDTPSRGRGTFAAGKIEPVVRIRHGSVPIYVRDLGKCLMIMGIFDIPTEVRTKLQAASAGERFQFFEGMRSVLMSCPRVGFALGPPGIHDPQQIERVALDQTIQIAENDPASFNRFCDAIQETETLLLKAADFMLQFTQSPSRPTTYSSSTPAPEEIYL